MFAVLRSPAPPADARQSRFGICTSDRGATAIEYALIAALIASVIFLALIGLGENLRGLPFSLINAALTAASPS